MRGIVRPCRHTVGGALQEQWRRHLCGLCLALRDEAGQGARVLTGYDVLLPSVLVDAQAGQSPTTKAGRCPLRGFATADVLAHDSPAMRVAAATALLSGSAALEDKVADHDIPRPTHRLAVTMARRLQEKGEQVAGSVGLDSQAMTRATRRAFRQQGDRTVTLDDVLEPAGSAVGAVFRQTALAAGTPGNEETLASAGDAFGRLVHLLDAVIDRDSDHRHGRYNPLAATATNDDEAHALARALHGTILAALVAAQFADRSLVDALFGPTLAAAIERPFRTSPPSGPGKHMRRQVVLSGVVASLAIPASFGRRRRRLSDESVRGEGCFANCGQQLACDCCASACCDACCNSF